MSTCSVSVIALPLTFKTSYGYGNVLHGHYSFLIFRGSKFGKDERRRVKSFPIRLNFQFLYSLHKD